MFNTLCLTAKSRIIAAILKIRGTSLEFLVTTSLGVETVLVDEITKHCQDVKTRHRPGQVLFEGELEHAYRICLWSRLANRVLLKLGEREVKEAQDVYALTSAIHWSQHFEVDNTFVIDFVGTNKAIKNTQFGALKIKDAIADQFSDLFGKRPSVDREQPDIRIQGRLKRNVLTLYLDLSGHSLHIRGYRDKTGEAPVKEHVAAAMLMRSGWADNMDKPLFDPMCGSGTVAIEAAAMAMNLAPGLSSDRWGFSCWKKHNAELWDGLKTSALDAQKVPTQKIQASDIDHRVLRSARENAQNAGVQAHIHFQQGDAARYTINSDNPGYIVSNPPYGERLGELTSLLPVFRKWGVHLKQHFPDWHLALLTSNRDLLKQLKLVSHKDYQLYNGNLECQLVCYVIDQQNQIVKQTGPSGDFANRLAKNLKQTRKWLKSQSTEAYRIYDADLPEYNVAIDRYGDWLVVQEYAAPKNIPEQKVKQRLHDVLVALPDVTEVNPEHIVLKTRAQQKGTNQYQKLSEKRQTMTVEEHGARFVVNLHDYLDTGLFLDHRITRQLVRKWSEGKHVLNLFAYTGSVSVNAAIGKARSVTTVDMSRTYLDWAKQNFTENRLRGAYEFIQADCTTWLSTHNRSYDLIFIDPPSFSNSKRMASTWDVQRDHISLLAQAKACLNPGGMIVFSNNLRKFKLDEPALIDMGLSADNISKQTLPDDFKRNPHIHQCWVIKGTSA